jgi:hypothetical protein
VRRFLLSLSMYSRRCDFFRLLFFVFLLSLSMYSKAMRLLKALLVEEISH